VQLLACSTGGSRHCNCVTRIETAHAALTQQGHEASMDCLLDRHVACIDINWTRSSAHLTPQLL
jgi:hypothetical protein